MKGDNSAALAQNKIRQEAFALQDTLSDIARWQKQIQQKDDQLTTKAQQARSSSNPKLVRSSSSSSSPSPANAPLPPRSNLHPRNTSKPTPGNIICSNGTAPRKSQSQTTPESNGNNDVEAPRNRAPRDVEERERGNELFKRGDFHGAVKCYTRAVGFNPRCPLAYSNRSMAYIKLKEFTKAEADCCDALALDPKHVKSLSRRGTARNALGRHKAAFCDFNEVLKLEPKNRQAAVEIRKTREFIKASVRKQPRKRVAVTLITKGSAGSEESEPLVVVHEAENEEGVDGGPSQTDKEGESAAVNEGSSSSVKKGSGETQDNHSKPTHKIQLKVPKRPPQTHYEFARVMKSLEREPSLQHRYVLSVVGPSGIAKVFAKSGTLEPEELLQMMILFKRYLDKDNSATTKALVAALGQSPRLEMTMMFLKKEEISEIVGLFNTLATFGHDMKMQRKTFKL